MIDPQKLQVLLTVLQRAPLTLAEQLIIQEVVDQLIALTTPEAAPAQQQQGAADEEKATNGARVDDPPLPQDAVDRLVAPPTEIAPARENGAHMHAPGS